MLKKLAVWCGLAVVVMIPVQAGNGHMLHGAAPVNSSMGGAGAGLVIEPVGALMFNPALITGVEGNQITFGTEFFEDGINIEVTLNDGTMGTTNPTNQVGVLPSFGWMRRGEDSKWAVGFGLIAIAGFRTDYPEDPDSILFDTPPGGFGRIYTDYRVTKIPFALAYQLTPKFSLGGSLNVYLAEVVLTATGAPATFQNHYSAGAGFQITEKVRADLGFYIVPREHVVGPFPDLDNNVLGTMDTSNKLTSVLVGLNWDF